MSTTFKPLDVFQLEQIGQTPLICKGMIEIFKRFNGCERSTTFVHHLATGNRYEIESFRETALPMLVQECINMHQYKQSMKRLVSHRTKGLYIAPDEEQRAEDWLRQLPSKGCSVFAQAVIEKRSDDLLPWLAAGYDQNPGMQLAFTIYTGVTLPKRLEDRTITLLHYCGMTIDEAHAAVIARKIERDEQRNNREFKATQLAAESLRTDQGISGAEWIHQLVEQGHFHHTTRKIGAATAHYLINPYNLTGYKLPNNQTIRSYAKLYVTQLDSGKRAELDMLAQQAAITSSKVPVPPQANAQAFVQEALSFDC